MDGGFGRLEGKVGESGGKVDGWLKDKDVPILDALPHDIVPPPLPRQPHHAGRWMRGVVSAAGRGVQDVSAAGLVGAHYAHFCVLTGTLC